MVPIDERDKPQYCSNEQKYKMGPPFQIVNGQSLIHNLIELNIQKSWVVLVALVMWLWVTTHV